MLFTDRKRVVLVVALLLSHAVLALHVSTHMAVDQVNCEFCSGEANPSHAVTPAIAGAVPAGAQSLPIDSHTPSPASAIEPGYRQRAPPTPA